MHAGRALAITSAASFFHTFHPSLCVPCIREVCRSDFIHRPAHVKTGEQPVVRHDFRFQANEVMRVRLAH